MAVGVEVDARQRTRAQWQAPALALGERKARAVAREHPEVSQQVMAEIHGLGALQMRVAGHRPVDVLLRARQQRGHQSSDRLLRSHAALARVHRQVGHHLVVARAGRVQPAADRPCDLGQAPLDRHVNVLVADGEREALLAQLGLYVVQAREQRVAIARRDDATVGQHLHVRARLRDVLRPQAPVEGDR